MNQICQQRIDKSRTNTKYTITKYNRLPFKKKNNNGKTKALITVANKAIEETLDEPSLNKLMQTMALTVQNTLIPEVKDKNPRVAKG